MKLSERLRLQAEAASPEASSAPVTDDAPGATEVVPAATPEAPARPLAALVTERQASDPQEELKLRLRMALYGRLGARLYDA
ncbi:MAG TPA: hypothetical protein VGH94_15500, partial [Acidimicrobiales bacterium]